jgi:hypothetical protein
MDSRTTKQGKETKMIVDVHYTDQHLTRRGSSIDLIERCAAFARQAGDFEGVLDYADDDESGKFQTMLDAP